MNWRIFPQSKPEPRHMDRYGYVLVWSRGADCPLPVLASQLRDGLCWLPMPTKPDNLDYGPRDNLELGETGEFDK